MKRILMTLAVTMVSWCVTADEWTDSETGITWGYKIENGAATVERSTFCAAISTKTTGAVAIPASLGDCPTKSIGNSAFYGCSGLTNVAIPEGVTNIGDYAFYWCSGLTNMAIPEGVTSIGDYAFCECSGLTNVTIPGSVTSIGLLAFECCRGLTSMTIPEGVAGIGSYAFKYCTGLTSVTIPSSVTHIGGSAFLECGNLKSLTFKGQAPACGDDLLRGTSPELVVYVGTGSSGWTQWNNRPLKYIDLGGGSGSASGTVATAQLTVTNVVIHYVVNSVQPTKVIPASADTGFVNIITEVKSGGAVSVPATWMVNYPNYVAKFGSDFTKSLMAETGKKDGANMPMRVWQDYVAGTDPTNPDDVFTASITTDASGKVIISCTPEFKDASEKAKRVYTTYGKKSLIDKTDWEIVEEGHEADYNFFKVTVEMK